MTNDLTFITNEGEQTLKDRFGTLIKDTRFFDVLVGYFYTSGFYTMYPALEPTEKIRILIGISTNQQTYDLIHKVQSYKQVGEEFSMAIREEMDLSDNTQLVESGVQKFLKWLQNGKLEIRAYSEEKIHSKLYIMTFQENDRDDGRVITGSSNFTRNGLVENLEFNVELKSPSDYHYAQQKFDELWKKGIDVSEKYIETVQRDTWLRDDITPYELYLKFLYEYFKEEINEDDSLEHHYRPDNFKELKYQDHAVINARKIVEEYGGVFLSDVVGLGKTFMGTMLCQELKGRTLVLAPPHLIDENNLGSWENAFRSFGCRARDYRCRSIGMLDRIIEQGEHKDFDIILIDEAHRFRNETTEIYTQLAQICRGKKVILVTATPYNNAPSDLLAQIKLFQRSKQSTLPNLPDLERFFKGLESRLKKLDRQKDKEEFIKTTKENAKLIREKVLKYLMVRRTRKEIMDYYAEDLEQQNMRFPKVAEPKPIFYEFNKEEDLIFFRTIELVSKDFKYARYTPLLYHNGVSAMEKQGQQNMMKFMKMLLIKRLESSFFAFRQTLSRFISSYEKFIKEFENGNVYVSKKNSQKIFQYLEEGRLEKIDDLIESGKAEQFPTKEFDEKFAHDLYHDRQILLEIEQMWKRITRDPKIIAFKERLAIESPVQNGKSIIFTESQETAMYLHEQLQEVFPNQIISFSGGSSALDRQEVISNFDANARNLKDDYKLLITTDVLAEGTNLHQSNVVINYDIPWNPTRIMQRVGRINRVDTIHQEIYSYTFFPTDQSNDQIKLRELAEAKIAAFISLLGVDAKLLTENEEVEAHSLFSRLISKEVIEGEDDGLESELRYLQEIRCVRDENPTLFEKIKRLPKKARTARKANNTKSSLVTYFRKGKLQKFVHVCMDTAQIPEEIDFITAAKILSAKSDEKRSNLNRNYYTLLAENGKMLERITEIEEEEYSNKRGSRDNASRLGKILKSKEVRTFQGFTEKDEAYISQVIEELDAGGIPKKLSGKIFGIIQSTPEVISNPIKLLGLLKLHLAGEFLESTYSQVGSNKTSRKEIILSEFFNADI